MEEVEFDDDVVQKARAIKNMKLSVCHQDIPVLQDPLVGLLLGHKDIHIGRMNRICNLQGFNCLENFQIYALE